MSKATGPSASEPEAARPPPPGQGNGGQEKDGARRRKRIQAGIAVLAVIAVGVLYYWFFFMRGIVFTDDARFAGHLIDVAPEISGRLINVAVHEGLFVHKGAVIFQLDPAIPQAELNKAEAALVSARASLGLSEALYDKAVNGSRPEEIKAAEATLKRFQDEERMARLDFERVQALFKGSAVSQNDFDRARTAHESAEQNREYAAQNLDLLRRGSRKEDIAAAKAALAFARSRVVEVAAAVESARSNLARCTVRAPSDGWVVRRWIDPGAMPLAAQPVISMFDPKTLRVDANIEEKYLDDVAIGDTADISVDAYPSLQLHGKVTEILRATNSEFSLIPSEGVSGTFIKVTQRVPLRIAVTVPQGLPIGPGLSVDVKIHVGSAAAK